jgi:hypothetical protein
MMFVCYSLSLGILGFAYHCPDLLCLIVLVVMANRWLR